MKNTSKDSSTQNQQQETSTSSAKNSISSSSPPNNISIPSFNNSSNIPFAFTPSSPSFDDLKHYEATELIILTKNSTGPQLKSSVTHIAISQHPITHIWDTGLTASPPISIFSNNLTMTISRLNSENPVALRMLIPFPPPTAGILSFETTHPKGIQNQQGLWVPDVNKTEFLADTNYWKPIHALKDIPYDIENVVGKSYHIEAIFASAYLKGLWMTVAVKKSRSLEYKYSIIFDEDTYLDKKNKPIDPNFLFFNTDSCNKKGK